ncbi:28 kDa heat- and acid-stable phosphoprotein-like isoform X1 [Amphibalanus amphitrite]|uniref:28 kDa heat- and acid-stable phosphoprotein-like isoform X1 n=1 Tax=Amphibalanus amphitrite TaxID=1232801 RepID=UPI001C922A3F|nr:28 kDa heat- and acid-stable phosphoprotein-like isoform X1 [Amphibalanus amphitrite]
MPKGKHKGKHRVFTNPEQLAEEQKREEREREWRQKRGEESESESGSGSGSESDSSSEEEQKQQAAKPKGPAVSVENPNRVQQRNKKLSQLNVEEKAPQQLSRREREAIEKEKARQHYQKLHAQGKTAEAQADLARLAIIRKQREEAAKKREEEKKAKEAAKEAGRSKR